MIFKHAPTSPRRLLEYSRLVDEDILRAITQAAHGLSHTKIAHINTDPIGGGVAEMLKTLIPLHNDLGIQTDWLICPPDDHFYEITKKIHNQYQGSGDKLHDSELEYYLNYNKNIAAEKNLDSYDILIVHDPQPAALIHFLKNNHTKTISHLHIDTSNPNLKTMKALTPYTDAYDAYVYSLSEYKNPFIESEYICFFEPAIDPLSPKNTPMNMATAKNIVSHTSVDPARPFVTQVSRFDPWKNPTGAIDAYRLAKNHISELQLVFLAQTSSDDPEEEEMEKKTRAHAKDDEDIHFLVDIQNNDSVVNAFQTSSNAVLQMSTREGFGLTVTEAMWKKNTVIGTRARGISHQITSGVDGIITNSTQDAGNAIVEIIRNPKKSQLIGSQAHRKVKKNSLITRLLLEYLDLCTSLTS